MSNPPVGTATGARATLPTWDEAVASVTGPGQRYELVDAVIDGVPRRVFANLPPSLRELFGSLRSRDGDQCLLAYEDERHTIADVVGQIDQLAAALVDRYGVRRGDRVAIAMRNYPEWVVSFAAVTSIGAVAVCFNAWWVADEMRYGLEDSGATLLIADPERIDRALPAMAELGVAGIVVRPGGPAPADGPATAGVDAYDEILVPGGTMPDQAPGPDDDAMILYTSGTTGHPKGAVSTHRAVLNGLTAYGARAVVNATMDPPGPPHPHDTCFILIVPLFHVTGLVPVMLSCVAGARKLVMLYKWDPERALELIEREKVTHFVGVPTMSWDLLESPSFSTRDTSSLLSVGGGGAPAPPELVRRVEASFGNGRPSIGYGMTETNAYGPRTPPTTTSASPAAPGGCCR